MPHSSAGQYPTPSTRLEIRGSEPPRLPHIVADLDATAAEEAALQAARTITRHVNRARVGAAASAAACGRAVQWRFAAAIAGLATAVAAGCATSGATFRSGVGDAFLERPPYYAGRSRAVVGADTTRVGHLPVVYQRGASQPSVFDPRDGRGTPVGDLLADLTDYLDALGATGVPGGPPLSTRLVTGSGVSAVAHAETVGPPDVQFGCVSEPALPDAECARRPPAGRRGAPMRLAVGRPAATWVAWARDVTRDVGVGRVLVVTLEVGQYLPRQAGVRGDKVVDLGTGYAAALPWLTSPETPVSVLQLTGALVGRDGRAVRIGAEGVLARRTRLLVSAAGGQGLLTEDDVARARALRRDDLPGRPYAWQAALRTLVAQLTGRDDLPPLPAP